MTLFMPFALTLIIAQLLLWVQICIVCKNDAGSKFSLSTIPNALWRRPGPKADAANSVSKLQLLRASSEQHGANSTAMLAVQDKQHILSNTSRVRDGRSLLPQFFYEPSNIFTFFALSRLLNFENQVLPGASVWCTRNRLSESPPA